MKKEGALEHIETSPTAASAGNRLYGNSGAMLYRVVVQSGSGLTPVEVEAKTGDEAAEKALERFMGGKVTFVGPAPQKVAAE